MISFLMIKLAENLSKFTKMIDNAIVIFTQCNHETEVSRKILHF